MFFDKSTSFLALYFEKTAGNYPKRFKIESLFKRKTPKNTVYHKTI